MLQLPSFDIVSGVGIDAMHCVYLGVVKQLVGLWFNPKHSGQRWYCGNSVEKVDKRLLEIKPPSVITRIPRSIQHHLKFWKGIKIEISQSIFVLRTPFKLPSLLFLDGHTVVWIMTTIHESTEKV